jgi:hypothetical protein
MAEPPVAAKITQTMFAFVPPRGVVFVNWGHNMEIRFLKTDGKALLQWWREQLARLENELPDLCEERVVTQCDDCNGHGRTGDNKVCMSCYGSGRKGFRPPGVIAKDELAPVTRKSSPVAVDEPIEKEVLDEARRIVESRLKILSGKLPPFKNPVADTDEESEPHVFESGKK